MQISPVTSGEIANSYRFSLNNPENTIDPDGLNPISILMAGLAIGNCGIALYDLDQYFKCMKHASDINDIARKKLDAEAACAFIKNNTGSQCAPLLSDALSRGAKCALWGAGRALLLKSGINPFKGGKL